MKKYLTYYLLFFIVSITGCKSSATDKHIQNAGDVSVDCYYVDGNLGNDSNPGTKKFPLRTIQEVNLRLQKNPCSVFLFSGQTFEGSLTLKAVIGSESEPLVITSYGNDRAEINGGNVEAIKIEDCKNIVIRDLNVRGNGRKKGNTTNGVSLIRTSNSLVEDLHTEGFQKSGLDLYNCTYVDVKNVFAFNNGFSGINIMGSDRMLSKNILIQDCRAENNPGDPTMLDNHSGNGILVGVSDYVIIDHCSATNNGWDMPREGNGPVGIWAWESSHVNIQYCISYRNKTSLNGKDGGGFDLDGGVKNSIIQYCLSYENEGAGYGLFQYSGASDWSDNIIRYCTSINDGYKTSGSGSIFLWNGSGEEGQLANCQIYNNIFYSDSVAVVSFENASSHKNFSFYNNVFIGSAQLINGLNSGSTFRGNVWWGMRKPSEAHDPEYMKINRIFQTLTDI